MNPPYTDRPSYFMLQERGRERCGKDLCTKPPELSNFWPARTAYLAPEIQLEGEQCWLTVLAVCAGEWRCL